MYMFDIHESRDVYLIRLVQPFGVVFYPKTAEKLAFHTFSADRGTWFVLYLYQ
jgi:hypothetical protein